MLEEFSQRFSKIEDALAKALPHSAQNEWQKNSFDDEETLELPYIQKLIEPNKELMDAGGKRWRPLLMILLYEESLKKNHGTALSESQVYALTPLVEFVHTASLIHDDIEDSSDFRRGKPAAYKTYGLDTALNCGSWLYFEAPVCINNSKIPEKMKLELYELYTRELRKLHLGQAMDIFWHRNPDFFPSAAEYSVMVKNKTGTLASLASQLGCLCGGMSAEESKKIGEIAANIGIGFQIIDDVINLTSGNPGKKRGDDIVEGKKSMPVLLHIQKNPENKEKIASFMKQASKEGINSPAVENCIALLNTNSCIKDASERGIKLIKENCQKLGSEKITALFNSMIPSQF